LPFDKTSSIISFNGDFLLLIYLLALSKFILIITALDSGSSFQGMGANREAFYSLLVEPSLFILIASWAVLTNNFSLTEIFSNLEVFTINTVLIGILSIFLLIQIALVENSRLPIDDPKTHLELTMIHEVMILDISGIDLALIHIGNYLKIAIFGNIIANLIIPGFISLPYKIVIYLIIQVLYAFSIGFYESFRARNKMAKNPKYLLSLSAIALIIFIMAFIIKNNLIV